MLFSVNGEIFSRQGLRYLCKVKCTKADPMKIAELLAPTRNKLLSLALQAGVTHAVSRLPVHPDGSVSWEFGDLWALKESYRRFGLKLEVIEPGLGAVSQMNNAKLGIAGRDEDIENCKMLIRNMGKLDIPVLCYNFMAKFNWVRTAVDIPVRGGALVSGYDHEVMRNAPLTDAGVVTEERLWDNLKYFLENIVPVAEASKVKLALHPDDPPVSSIQGVSRIIRNLGALKKAIGLVPSRYSGVTFCQGTLAAAGERIPEAITELGEQDKIFFVHFRDVVGNAEKFSETFHDEGQTDMFAAMRAYRAIGFDGPVRVDHVPTMEGDSNSEPGYSETGRLFALGYLKGLKEAAEKLM